MGMRVDRSLFSLFSGREKATSLSKGEGFVCRAARVIADSANNSAFQMASNTPAWPVPTALAVAAAAGELGTQAACGDSRQPLPQEAGAEGSGDDLNSPPVSYPDETDDNVDDNVPDDDNQPPQGSGYDQSDIVPPWQSTYCEDNDTLVVANAETGEAISTTQCPPNMSCMYDICVQNAGNNFPPGARDTFGDGVPSICHWPRRIGGGEESDEFWNQFDPQNIKRNFTRCIFSGHAANISGWSVARAEDFPEPTWFEHTENVSPYSNPVPNACGDGNEGIFLTSHDPWAWAEMTFTGLPVYRDEDPQRHADFYVVEILPFFNGAVPSTSIRRYSRSNGGGSGSSGELPHDMTECNYALLNSIFDSASGMDETQTVYLQPLDNDGLGLASARIWTCICPLATEGAQ